MTGTEDTDAIGQHLLEVRRILLHEGRPALPVGWKASLLNCRILASKGVT